MNTLLPLLVPIGAVTAAITAGLFSYLALVISKEQKTSEFRQAWVDALREDVADFIASVRLIRYAIHNLQRIHPSGVPPKAQMEAAYDPYEKATTAYNRLLLRLNPKNPPSAAVIIALKAARDALSAADYQKAADLMEPVRESARIVLKEEWERVKKGEQIFVWSKRILGIIILGACLGLGLVVYFAQTRMEASQVRYATPETEMHKPANQALLPTPTAVTPPAAQDSRQP
jgi:hypothetical protein